MSFEGDSRHSHRLWHSARRRSRSGRKRPLRLPLLVVVAAAVVAVVVLDQPPSAGQQRLAVVARFDAAWTRGNYGGMYAELRPTVRRRISLQAFAAAYRGAARTAGLTAITLSDATATGDHVVVHARVATHAFAVFDQPVSFTVSLAAGDRGIAWSARDRFPGLRGSEQLTVRLVAGRRGAILAGNGTLLSPTSNGTYPLGVAGELIAGQLGRSTDGLPVGVSGLEQVYNTILTGTPGQQLWLGERLVAATPPRAGVTVRTTIDPQLQQAATAALGSRYGAIAVVRPSTGAVLALAGIALSSAQPPGSTFKIITATAALQGGFASLASSYPLERSTTVDGYTLHNADGEACGGTLLNAFAVSCNSVFVPLGARIGAARLVATADAYGFNRTPRVADELPSTLPGAGTIGDALAVGSSAIGQGRVLATPLEMATVAATVADGGMRARPRLLASLPVITQQVTTPLVAGELRELMLAVVAHGTGTAVAIPGVPVAAKTGTAELENGPSTASNPSNTDAWFVAFPAVARPPVAVAVMLVRDGAGGQAAAPLARQVLLTALHKRS